MNEAGKVVVRDDVGLAARWSLGGKILNRTCIRPRVRGGKNLKVVFGF